MKIKREKLLVMDKQEIIAQSEKEKTSANNQGKKLYEEHTIFALETTFPDASGIFFGDYQKLEDCIDKAIFVLDTSVLLVPYSLSNKSINEIQKVYKRLIAKNKLFIPERAAREYAKNRSRKIADIFESISKIKAGLVEPKSAFPIVNDMKEKVGLDKAFESLKVSHSKYSKAIDVLLDQIRSWEWNDPVNIAYANLFSSATFCSHKLSNADLVKELARRFELKQPPGYKDSSKDDGGVGDLAIWLSILQLGKDKKKHLIFISEDGKPDWWQRSNGSEFLPRYELIDEYRRESGGKTVHIINLTKLLQIFNASEATIKEAKNVEKQNNSAPLKTFRQFNKEFDKRENFRKLRRHAQKEEILRWFSDNFTDPVNCCPYESAEGGYQYIWGGPYNAHEEIEAEYGNIASQHLINEIVNELESISFEWSGHPSQD